MPELIIVVAIMLVIFGPAKLPQLGASLGQALRSFKKGMNDEPRIVNPKEDDKEPH